MAPASATPPTQPGPALILRAQPFVAGPPPQIDLGPLSRSSGAHLLPQHHSPLSLSPSFSRFPTSLVLGPTPIHTQTNPSVSSSPLLLSPLPQLFSWTYLLPCGPAHQDTVPPPSPFPLGRPKSLVRTPLGSLQHPSPNLGPAPPCSGPALSSRPRQPRPLRPLPLASSLGSRRGSATECRRDSGSAAAAGATGGSEVTVNLRLMARGAAGSHKWPQPGC